MGVWVYCNHCPDERAENEQDIYCSQKIALQAKLEGRESEIENEIEDEWYNNNEGDFLLETHEEDLAKGNNDNDIQNRPYRPKEERRWCPRRLTELLVPSVTRHSLSSLLHHHPSSSMKKQFEI